MRKLVTLIILLWAVLFIPNHAYAEGDIVRFGGDIIVAANQRVGNSIAFGGSVALEGMAQDVVAFGGSVRSTGEIMGNAIAFGGDVELFGAVEGDVIAIGGEVILRDGANIKGDVVLIGGRLHTETGVAIGGEILERNSFRFEDINTTLPEGGLQFLRGVFSFFKVFGAFSIVILGWLIGMVMAPNVEYLAESIKEEGLKAFIIGLVVKVFSPLFLIVLLITVLGIPLVPLLIPLLWFSQLLGLTALAFLFSRIITVRIMNRELGFGVTLFIGLVFIAIIGMLPFIGWIAIFILKSVGLGAVLMTKFGSGKPWFNASPRVS